MTCSQGNTILNHLSYQAFQLQAQLMQFKKGVKLNEYILAVLLL